MINVILPLLIDVNQATHLHWLQQNYNRTSIVQNLASPVWFVLGGEGSGVKWNEQ